MIQLFDARGVGCHVTQDDICLPQGKQALDGPQRAGLCHVSLRQKNRSFQGRNPQQVNAKHEASGDSSICKEEWHREHSEWMPKPAHAQALCLSVDKTHHLPQLPSPPLAVCWVYHKLIRSRHKNSATLDKQGGFFLVFCCSYKADSPEILENAADDNTSLCKYQWLHPYKPCRAVASMFWEGK